MNNSVHGKTIENIRNRIDVRLINNKKTGLKLSSKPNLSCVVIFDENLCASHIKKLKIYFNKPVYLGKKKFRHFKNLNVRFSL